MPEKQMQRFRVRFLDGSYEDLFAHDFEINGVWVIFYREIVPESALQPIAQNKPFAAYKEIAGVEWISD